MAVEVVGIILVKDNVVMVVVTAILIVAVISVGGIMLVEKIVLKLVARRMELVKILVD